jgi:hypothetical protein
MLISTLPTLYSQAERTDRNQKELGSITLPSSRHPSWIASNVVGKVRPTILALGTPVRPLCASPRWSAG